MEYERPSVLRGVHGAAKTTPTTKICTKCGEEKALDGFHVCSRNLDGRQSWCKECRRAHQTSTRGQRRAYWETNKDKLNLKRRAHYAADREKLNVQQRAYRSAHGQESKTYMAAYIKRYWVANKDALKAQHQVYRDLHRDELNHKQREYEKTERGRQKKAEWYAAHPEKARAMRAKQVRKRRSRVQQSYVRFSADEERELKGHGCFLCGSREHLTVAHDIPVGPNGPLTAANTFCLCQPCNTRMGRNALGDILQQLELAV